MAGLLGFLGRGPERHAPDAARGDKGPFLEGLMQDVPLSIPDILDHAACFHGAREMVTRTLEGPIHRTTYADLHLRARKCAQALKRLGVKPGERIATLAWNTYRHFEAWYGIIGTGAVCHTINPRLFEDQIVYISNHAENPYIFTDTTFVPILEKIADRLDSAKAFIVLADRAHMPKSKLKNLICYEDMIAAEDGRFNWVRMPETAAAGLCYTSGTTGNPKGVLYSHRSNILMYLASGVGDGISLHSSDTILAVVPMFHANSWGLVYSAPSNGAKLVLPGMKLDGPSVYELLETEKVTFTAAVPTVWLMLLQHLEANNLKLSTLKRVVIGGSAVPRRILEAFEDNYGVEVIHAWGMTETSPIGTLCVLKAGQTDLPRAEQVKIKLKQGRPIFPVQLKIVDDEGKALPHDGKAFGRLMIKGPFIAKAYFKGEGGDPLDADGYFDTGDVATIDGEGFIQITDRAKDVIKSGGEWISSIEIENIAVGHPKVAEAAVIGLYHPKWDERPLLIIVPKAGESVTREEILAYLEGKIAKWWMPDDVVFIEEMPHTATGKIQKTALREMFKDHVLPTAK
ncbi:MAG: long-chain-fatty-acid--CoA ligase [Alphaproteobacteria bacterium]|nr:long-chain-fatty-acid--CoA ligase [Alphaproteobacteria bacterium]